MSEFTRSRSKIPEQLPKEIKESPFIRQRSPNKNNKSNSYIVQTILNESKNIKPKGNGSGRRSKLTYVVEKVILHHIDLGMNIEDACSAAGVTYVSWWNWLKWGREEAKGIKEDLNLAINESMDQGVINVNDPNQLEEYIDEFMKLRCPSKYFKLFDKVRGAEAVAQARDLANIQRCAEGGKYLSERIENYDKEGILLGEKEVHRYVKPDWNASAWRLSRKYPALYGEKVTHAGKVEHDHGHSVVHKVEIPETDDRLAGVLGILIGSGAVSGKLIEHRPE